MTGVDWNAQIRAARSMHAAKPTRTQAEVPLPREPCPELMANGAPCGKPVAAGRELCPSHGALDRESKRIDKWFGQALRDLEGREPDDERAQLLRAAIVEAVGMLSRNPRRRVAPLRAVGEVLMCAATGQTPKVPATADPMAKEWGTSGA